MSVLILNKTQAASIKGRHGIYSALIPDMLPDGTYVLPIECIDDPDLKDVKTKLQDIFKTGSVAEIHSLPRTGELCEAGIIYFWERTIEEPDEFPTLVKCVQTHNKTIFKPDETPALFSFFRKNSDTLEWITNEYVQVGWKRIYQVIQYEVIQAHQTQITWNPIATLGVLWRSLAPPTGDLKAGVAYKINDVVMYLGKKYKCRQAHTSQVGWQPPNVPALWLLI